MRPDGWGPRKMKRAVALGAVVAMTLAVAGCGDAKAYDIGPLFPLTADKCAKYDGDAKGEGLWASCMVTKAQCERAVADWNQSMRDGGVDDALLFTCD